MQVTHQKFKKFSLVLFTLMITPMLTSFVLLSKRKSALIASPDSPTVTFYYDPNGDMPSLSKKEEIANGQYANLTDKQIMPILIQLAMDQWNGAKGSFLKMNLKAGITTLERSDSDRVNVILAEKNANLSTSAFANPTFNPDNLDEIYDCDISMAMNSVTATHFLKVMTHELGHCVGLGHPHQNFGAIMSYGRMGDSNKLGADDMAGLIYLYPDPDYVSDSPHEVIGCGNVGLHSRAGAASLLVILLLPIFYISLKIFLKSRTQKT